MVQILPPPPIISTIIEVSDVNLNSLRTSIQNYITNNQVTIDNVNNHITNINNFVSTTKTTDNQNLGNFVGSITYSNNAFTISLNSNYKMNVKSLSNIQVNVNSIVMNNFNFYVKPSAQESPEDWFTWSGTQITGLSTLGTLQKNIVLPSKATSITNNAFYNNKTLVTVDMSLTKISVIPDGIVATNGLFAHSSNISSIKLPSSLTSIGSNAFWRCTSLTSITIPDSVTLIGDSAFASCTSLTSITLSNSLTLIVSYAFHNCSSLTSITIPNSVISIGGGAFENCTSLTSIDIPNSVTSIGSNLFRDCTKLESVKLSSKITSIGNFTFWECTSLTSITIPDSVTEIGVNAFWGCTSLTSITMSNSVTKIGTTAFTAVSKKCVMYVKSNWNTKLATDANFQGTFQTY